MTVMKFRYGGHTHADGEVNLVRMEIIPIYSDRNRRLLTRYKLHIQGELIPTAAEIAAADDVQDAIRTKIEALVLAYSENNQWAGLLHADGTNSTHVLDPADLNNISGNRIEYRSWPRGAPDEYATVRTFYIIIAADYLDLDSQIVQYSETVRAVGSAPEPIWRWHIGWNGATVQEVQQIVSPIQRQHVYQYGSITGLTLYPIGNVPPALNGAYEHVEDRIIEYGAPKWHGQAHLHYPIRWSYHMEGPSGMNITPTIDNS